MFKALKVHVLLFFLVAFVSSGSVNAASIECPPLGMQNVPDWLTSLCERLSGTITALTNPAAYLASRFYDVLFPLGIFIGLVAIVFAAYRIMTSQGIPDNLKIGSENLTSAILGILFIVLSLGLLRVIINTLFGGGL